MHTYTSVYVASINEKRECDTEREKEGYMGLFGGRKGKGEKYNYITSKNILNVFKKVYKIFNSRYICICYIGNEYINILIFVYKYRKYFKYNMNILYII